MARRKQPHIPDQLLDQLLAGTDAKAAFAKDGLLDELKKALAERVLNASAAAPGTTFRARGREKFSPSPRPRGAIGRSARDCQQFRVKAGFIRPA